VVRPGNCIYHNFFVLSTFLTLVGELDQFEGRTLPKDWKVWKEIFPGLPKEFEDNFEYSISTDGFSASLLCTDPHPVPDLKVEPPKKRRKKKKNESTERSSQYISSTPVRYSEFTRLNEVEEEMIRKFVLQHKDELLIQAHDPGETHAVTRMLFNIDEDEKWENVPGGLISQESSCVENLWKTLIRSDSFSKINDALVALPSKCSPTPNSYIRDLSNIWGQYWGWISSSKRLKARFQDKNNRRMFDDRFILRLTGQRKIFKSNKTKRRWAQKIHRWMVRLPNSKARNEGREILVITIIIAIIINLHNYHNHNHNHNQSS